MEYVEYCGGDLCKAQVINFAIKMDELSKQHGLVGFPLSRELVCLALNDVYGTSKISSIMSQLQAEKVLIPVKSEYSNSFGNASKWYEINPPQKNNNEFVCRGLDAISNKLVSQFLPEGFVDNLCEVVCDFINDITTTTTVVEMPVKKAELNISAMLNNVSANELIAYLNTAGTLSSLKAANPIAFAMLKGKFELANVGVDSDSLKGTLLKVFELDSNEFVNAKRIFSMSKGASVEVNEENFYELISRFKATAVIKIEGNGYRSMVDLIAHLGNWERLSTNCILSSKKIKAKHTITNTAGAML